MNASVPERTLQHSVIRQPWAGAIRQNSASESDTARQRAADELDPAKRDHPMPPCFPFVPGAVATPKGFNLGSRGPGHPFRARRPRTAPPIHPADPAGVELFGPSRAEPFFDASLPWVSPAATHVAPLRGARNGQTSSSRTGRTSGLLSNES
jgi:hypothetical protein